jgi:hypothetical protein
MSTRDHPYDKSLIDWLTYRKQNEKHAISLEGLISDIITSKDEGSYEQKAYT